MRLGEIGFEFATQFHAIFRAFSFRLPWQDYRLSDDG